MKKILSLICLMMLAMTSAWADEGNATKTVTFINDANWAKVCVWAWNDDENFTGGVWPGVVLTAGADGNYTWSTEGNPTKIIFSDGDNIQTSDLEFKDGGMYNSKGLVFTATFTTNAGWEEVYAYVWSGNGENKILGEWPGTKLDAVNGVYTVIIEAENAPEKIIFNNGIGGDAKQQTADLAFENGKAYRLFLSDKTFDFEINNGNWTIGEGANYAQGELTEENPITMDDITLTGIQGGATNAVRYYTNSSKGNCLWIFKNNSIKLTAPEGKSITKIEFTMQTGSFDLTTSTGELADNIWTGKATEVTFGPNAKGTRYVYAIDVTVEDGQPLETFTATFKNDADPAWEAVYAYTWSGEGESKVEQLGQWPGIQLTANAETGLYELNKEGVITLPEFIIFHNNAGTQTSNLAFEEGKEYSYWGEHEFAYQKYVIQNAVSSKFWGTGNTWDTQATLVDHPVYVKLVPAPEGKYRLETQVSQGGTKYWFSGDYMDSDEKDAVILTVTRQAEPLGYKDDEETQPVYLYTIANGDNYYGNNTESTLLGKNLAADSEDALWLIVTLEEARAAIADADLDDPADATVWVEDYNFNRNNRYSNRWQGWGDGVKVGTDDGNMNAESYEHAFDVYQEIEGLPAGVYELNAQAAVTFHDTRVKKPFDGIDMPVVYMSVGETEVNSDFNEMIAADQLTSQKQLGNQFNAGKYKVEPLFIELTKDAKLKIGARGVRTDIWAVWDNYVLTYYGSNCTVEQAKNAYIYAEMKELEEQAEDMKSIVTSEEALAGLNAAINQAEAAKDATAIQAAIDALKTAIANAEKSRFFPYNGVAYVLSVDKNALYMAAGHNYGTRGIVNEIGLDLTFVANEETNKVTIDTRVYYNNDNHFLGSNLYMDSQSYEWGLEAQEYGFYISDAEGKYIGIDDQNNLVLSDTPHTWTLVKPEAVMAERLNELAKATKDNPKDATFLIKAQNFNRNDARNKEAWIISEDCTNWNLSGGNGENNNAESYHSPFTIMQTISEAPAGYYQLTTQGFYRQDEYEGETPAAPMFFANEINSEVPPMGELPDHSGDNNNGMDDASVEFTNGNYTIEPITFEVKEDGKMYVGVTGSVNTQWVCWDNFTLKYFGEDNPTTGISAVIDNGIQSNAIYNLNGQRVMKAQKGLYIVNGKKQVVK